MWSLRGAVVLIGLIATAAGVTPFFKHAFQSEDSSSMLTHKVRLGDVKVTITEDGTIESSSNKEIKCKVKGGSTVLWVIETGTTVKPGDELVRLDTALIEENITQQQILYERALATKIVSASNVAVAKTNITEYAEGTYLEERSTIEKEIFDAEEVYKKAILAYESAVRLTAKGMFRSLQLDGEKFAVDSAQKDLELKKQKLQTLDKYKKEKMLQELQGALLAAEANLAADIASLQLEKDRLARDREQLENCVIRSEVSGMVIFPSAAAWKEEPDIEEGAVVREQQTLLVIPDLTAMQVKVGIHESKVDKLRVGMPAKVASPDLELDGEIESIATITRPSGWWTGNMVKYDTIIKLNSDGELKPGMSAVAEILVADHRNVLTVPVAAIVEDTAGYHCWVKTGTQVKRRTIELGDSNDEFTVVKTGLKEGDDVVLNPRAYIEEAQNEALQPASNETEFHAETPKPADMAKAKSNVKTNDNNNDAKSDKVKRNAATDSKKDSK